jgi:preprotein translocase subunit SecG
LIRRRLEYMILNVAIIIVSIALIASVLLQSKGIGLGGLAGGDTGGVYTQRRGIEKVMFYITIALSVVFLLLALINVIIS